LTNRRKREREKVSVPRIPSRLLMSQRRKEREGRHVVRLLFPRRLSLKKGGEERDKGKKNSPALLRLFFTSEMTRTKRGGGVTSQAGNVHRRLSMPASEEKKRGIAILHTSYKTGFCGGGAVRGKERGVPSYCPRRREREGGKKKAFPTYPFPLL